MAVSSGNVHSNMQQMKFRAMGTTVELAVIPEPGSSPETPEQALAAAKERITVLEQRLSRFVRNSDVSYINAQAGRYVRVSIATVTVVELALTAHKVSGGLFCPWMGAVIEQLGYDVSFEQIRSRSRQDGFSLSRNFVLGTPPLHVEPEESLVCIDQGYHLDLGGLAKGWIVEQAVEELVSRGFKSVVVSAGGDMVFRGRFLDRPWTVGIANPWDESQYLYNLEVEDLALATSGTYRRRWQTSEGEVHHLLDPRTGTPSQSDIVSCSVVGNRLTGAEVLAKTTLLLGREEGMRWLESQPHQGFVIVTKDKEVFHTWNSSMNAKSRR